MTGSSGFKALFGLSKKDLASDKELDANAIAALRHEAALCVQVGREVKRALSWLTTSLRAGSGRRPSSLASSIRGLLCDA